MNKIKDFFYSFIDILLLLAILFASGYVVYYNLDYLMNLKTTTEVTSQERNEVKEADLNITIPNDTDSKQLAKLLKSYNLIDKEDKFIEKFNDINEKAEIKSGEFKISPHLSYEEIIKKLTK
ncbi:MAG: hypothetical protein Q4E50_00400 [Tissierellia bacterium]|nr:hypothetical protein [Tissierellia bacterium]